MKTNQHGKKIIGVPDEITNNLIHLFEQSVGWEFRVKGTPLTDWVGGVDHKFKMVKGKKYGDFHVTLCELTGRGPIEN